MPHQLQPAGSREKREWGVELRKPFLVALILVFVDFFVSAEPEKNNDFSFSFAASIGLLSGASEEIVYRDDYSTEKLSQLIWEIKPLAYAGFDLRYIWVGKEYGSNFFTNVSFKFGFQGNTGLMEDRDWKDYQNPGNLTDYSVHDNTTRAAFLLDTAIGGSIKLSDESQLKLFISYSYMYFSWAAYGGSFLYPGANGHFFEPDSSKLCGTYKQDWNILSPGVAFHWALNRILNIEISLKVSPFIWCRAEDDHVLISTVFNDNLAGGTFMEPGLIFSFKPVSFLSLEIPFSYRYISDTRGNTVTNKPGRPPKEEGYIGGAGFAAFNVGITLKFNLTQSRWFN